jgi:hypothetical protein
VGYESIPGNVLLLLFIFLLRVIFLLLYFIFLLL